jgi:hypothetical protein
LIVGEAVCKLPRSRVRKGIWEISVPSAQFCYESETAVKIKYIKENALA